MTKKAVVALIVAAVVLTGTAVGAASSLWGEASEKPPCAEWRDRVFDKTTGEFLPVTADRDTGFSGAAARGLLDESGCEWVFRPSGDKTNVYWDRRYALEVVYDIMVVQYAVERNRLTDYSTVVHLYNENDYWTYDAWCEEEAGGEVWQDAVGTEWCNIGSDDFDWDEGDYVIRGPR